jgi:hypothetical protein
LCHRQPGKPLQDEGDPGRVPKLLLDGNTFTKSLSSGGPVAVSECNAAEMGER